MTTKAVRATIKIAGINIEAFHLPSGEYVMSQSQVADAVDVDSSNILRFLSRKQVEALPANDSKFCTLAIEGSKKPIKVIPTKEASAFWFDQAMKGNSKAQLLSFACMEETLQRRCDNAFSTAKTEQEYENRTFSWLDRWQKSRGYLREAHSAFERTCDKEGFSRCLTHNQLTKAICGRTANELKQLELVCGDEGIGLNHIKEEWMLVRVARAKVLFSKYRKGDAEARINRAKEEILREETALKVTFNN